MIDFNGGTAFIDLSWLSNDDKTDLAMNRQVEVTPAFYEYAALVINSGKMLSVRFKDATSDFYFIPMIKPAVIADSFAPIYKFGMVGDIYGGGTVESEFLEIHHVDRENKPYYIVRST